MKKIIKFLVSGGSAAFVEFCTFSLIMYYLSDRTPLFAQTASYLAGFVVSFTLHRTWVFQSLGPVKGELAKYALLAIINIILTNTVLIVLTDVIGVNVNMSKIFVMGMVALWNYLIFNRIIFKNQEQNRVENEKAEE